MYGFHYLPCSLCQLNVDESQPESYYMLPLDPTYASLLSYNDWYWDPETQRISNGDFKSTQYQTYPSLTYEKRSILFHQRCFYFVKNLSYSQLYLLNDVVEPTFLKRSSPPNSEHGAFSSHGLSFPPSTWTIPQLLDRLPLEIQKMVFEHDIGRLVFVMRTASQIATRYKGLKTIPERRLAQTILILKGDMMIRIHSINIGGRIYISYISDTTDLGHDSMESQDYELDESGYLAVKSDGIGVIDIAFRATDAGPEWILDNHTGWRIQPEMSIVRCADVRQLRIICDALKCRAIVPLNRTGAEPYFQTRPFPPQDSWVDSSFAVESELTVHHDPFAYFTRATYIPFDRMKNITFDIDPGRLGINQITANDPEPPEWKTSIYFPEPPIQLKFFLCGVSIGNLHTFKYPFLQFKIDGQWQPPLPHDCSVLRQILVEDVLGIWWSETFPFIPIHIGTVVSNKAALKNTVLRTKESKTV